ncbi:hypothetical protein ALC56_03249, partial [Trachymyrmex septentrionalis]
VTTRVPVERGSSEVIRHVFMHECRNIFFTMFPAELARRGTSAGMVQACLRGFPWIVTGIRQRNGTHVVLRDPTGHTTHFPTTHTANDTTKRDRLSAMASVSATPIGCSATNRRTANDGRESGEKVILKTALLTSLNILQLYNKHITSLIPPDPAELEAKKELEEEKKKKKKRPHHRVKLWSKHRGVFHLI